VCPRIEDQHAGVKGSKPSLGRGDVHGEDRVPVSSLRSVPDR
jgi:hypothetical protein